MKRLTYRGIAYQKSEEAITADQELKRVHDGSAPHVYRGNVYHYEAPKKELVS